VFVKRQPNENACRSGGAGSYEKIGRRSCLSNVVHAATRTSASQKIGCWVRGVCAGDQLVSKRPRDLQDILMRRGRVLPEKIPHPNQG